VRREATTTRPEDRKGRGEDLHRQVDELVSRVPRHAIRAVIDEIDSVQAQNKDRAQHLRDALVEHFNRLRPFKARRLFTGLFEPLLVDDPVLYRTHEAVPGLLQRVDMGGVWHALSQQAFPLLAMEVQDRLDAMSQDDIIDRVLASPEAMAMRESMRAAAAAWLGDTLRQRKRLEEFLALANREALRDARQRTPHLSYKAPIDHGMLRFLHTVLEHNAALLPLIERMRHDLNDVPAAGAARHAEVDGQAAIIVGFVRRVRAAFPTRDLEDPLAWLAPLYALNVKRRYDVVQRYAREYGGPSFGEPQPLQQALLGHFSGCCTTLGELVRGLFGDAAPRDAHALPLSRPVRDTLDDALTRFEQSLSALSATGLTASRTIGPRVRTLLGETAAALTGLVLPVALERALAAAQARHAPAPDHDDVLWLLDRVWRWGATLEAVGYASLELRTARGRIVAGAGTAFVQAIKVADGDDLSERMSHVVRVNAILNAIGEDVTPWIGPVSQGLQRIVRHHLEAGEEVSPEARFIIDTYAGAVRSELNRSRHWQCADLVSLVRLYESRLD